ncbi:hypothetical protein F4776DRAFT_671656 [Hypoxylon sp. NC0597]|nr:hypothetical protein F4776DRAFT_671656 [Hypoxylon sp. NC0597]
MGFYYILFLSCLWAASLVSADPFSVDICPVFFLRRSTIDSDPDKFEFYATCKDSSHGYRTSSLSLATCFTNQNGDLIQANTGAEHPGPFSPTCWNCGISLEGPKNIDGTGFNLILGCSCEHEVHEEAHSSTYITLDPAIFVTNGILGCFQDGGAAYNGVEIHYGPSVHLPMPLPPTTTTLTTTVTRQQPTTLVTTVVTTATQNNTITSTDTVTTEATIVSTAISTDVTTAITTVSPSPVTITKTPKKAKPKTKTATKTLTETHSVTQTVYVTSPSTVVVTVTPTHSKTIFAEITDSHFALFSTSELP